MESGSYVVNLFAVPLCLLIALVLNQGMKSAARFETLLVYLKVAVVVLRLYFASQPPQVRPGH